MSHSLERKRARIVYDVILDKRYDSGRVESKKFPVESQTYIWINDNAERMFTLKPKELSDNPIKYYACFFENKEYIKEILLSFNTYLACIDFIKLNYANKVMDMHVIR